MTCKHQWADATTNAGPEWVCAKCKVTYSETKKAPPAKREWVGLTDEEIKTIWRSSEHMNEAEVCRAIEDKIKEKNA